MIQVSELSKDYGDFSALRDASFNIDKDSGITALLGPNGAGKTTTMRLMTGFLEPTRGSITLAGHNMSDEAERLAARRKIGYLPETTPLYGEMLVSEYLQFMGRARGLDELQLEKRATAMMEKLELQSHFYTPIGILSKGFRQRVALAATLIHEPEIIILDEPTSGLDPNQIAHIRNLIKDLGQDATVILSTHILQEVEDICDRVIIISQGQIVADDKMTILRQQAQNPSFEIVARKKDNGLKLISGMNGVNNAREIGSAEHVRAPEGYESYMVELDDDRPEVLFKSLADAGFEVRRFAQHRRSLEDIFKELTVG